MLSVVAEDHLCVCTMASTLRKPQPPAFPPPPSVIPDDSHWLFRGYKLLHLQESEKPAEERLAGEAYFRALLWFVQDVRGQMDVDALQSVNIVVVDGHEYEERRSGGIPKYRPGRYMEIDPWDDVNPS